MKTRENMLLFDDFSQGLDNWTQRGGGGQGKWYVADDTLYWDGIAAGADNRHGALITQDRFSGIVQSVECDTCFTFPAERPKGAYNGFLLCACYQGHYMPRVVYNTDEKANTVKVTFQILKRAKGDTSYATLAQSADLNAEWGLGIASGVWFHLRVTLQEGRIEAFINDTLVLSCQDDAPLQEGLTALRPAHCDAAFRNVKICGTPKPLVHPLVTCPTLPPKTYTYTFQEEAEGVRPAPFCEALHKANWKTVTKNGQKYLSTDGHHADSCLWIHGYEENPTVRAQLYATPVNKGAKAGIFARYGVDSSYIEAGYDFDAQKWYLCYRQGQNFDETYLYAPNTAPFDQTICHNLTATFAGNAVTLQDNGLTVLHFCHVPYISWGRCGIFSHYTAVDLQSFACDFPAGGTVTHGVESATFWPEEYLNFLEIERINDTDVVAFTYLKRMLSTDRGKTFSDVSDHPDWQMLNYDSDYSSVLKMHNGEFLMINGIDDFKVHRSTDMKRWTYVTQVLPTEQQYAANGKKTAILHVSTPTEFALPNGVWRIFLPICFRYVNDIGAITGHYTRLYYSDDGGRSWTASQDATLRTVGQDNPYFSISELKVILCADGSLRMYSTRNTFGCAACFISRDYGITWPEFVKIPEMPCAMSSFGVAEDPANPGSYFMVYVKNIPYPIAQIFPRTRLVLVHSTDGVHWQPLADIDRFTNVEGTPSAEPYQILDPSITVCKDFIYVGWGRSSKGEPGTHNAQRARYLRIDRAKAGF